MTQRSAPGARAGPCGREAARWAAGGTLRTGASGFSPPRPCSDPPGWFPLAPRALRAGASPWRPELAPQALGPRGLPPLLPDVPPWETPRGQRSCCSSGLGSVCCCFFPKPCRINTLSMRDSTSARPWTACPFAVPRPKGRAGARRPLWGRDRPRRLPLAPWPDPSEGSEVRGRPSPGKAAPSSFPAAVWAQEAVSSASTSTLSPCPSLGPRWTEGSARRPPKSQAGSLRGQGHSPLRLREEGTGALGKEIGPMVARGEGWVTA